MLTVACSDSSPHLYLVMAQVRQNGESSSINSVISNQYLMHAIPFIVSERERPGITTTGRGYHTDA